MGFCCGASMVGAIGTMRHHQTYITNVPLLYCPVCHQVTVHPKVEEEFDLLAEFAHSDGAVSVDFREYVDAENREDLFENCSSVDHGDLVEVLRAQIDIALDLLSVAKQLGDKAWEQELINRLAVLSERLRKWRRKNVSTQGR